MSNLVNLIERLQNATEGSLALDEALHMEDGWTLDIGLGRYQWIRYDGQTGPLPYYTRRIDAALPGENIVSMVVLDDKLFRCIHLSDNGTAHQGEHRIEAIARRIAALKAHKQAELTELTKIAQETDTLR